MSKKGCSPDNSACEGFFGRMKNEFYYGKVWTKVSLKEFIVLINNYIHWYNEKRIKESLGYMSPVEYRESLGIIS
jgi:transposase InsO family protein